MTATSKFFVPVLKQSSSSDVSRSWRPNSGGNFKLSRIDLFDEAGGSSTTVTGLTLGSVLLVFDLFDEAGRSSTTVTGLTLGSVLLLLDLLDEGALEGLESFLHTSSDLPTKQKVREST